MARQNSTHTTPKIDETELRPPQSPRIVGEIVDIMYSISTRDPVLRVVSALLRHKNFRKTPLSNYGAALTVRIRNRLESDASKIPTASLIGLALEEAFDLRDAKTRQQSHHAKLQEKNLPGIRIVSPITPTDLD